MKRFAELCADLERTTRPNVIRQMINTYSSSVSSETAALAMSLIDGSLSLRILRPREVASAVQSVVALPPWLIDQSRTLGGTLAETSALLLPRSDSHCEHSLESTISLLTSLQHSDLRSRSEVILGLLQVCSIWERIVLTRIITGSRPTRCDLPQQHVEADEATEHRMITTVLYAHKAPSIGQQTYSHFTVGVKKGEIYVPLAKIPNTFNEEISTIVEGLATQRTVEKFGPTHWVSAGIIVEIAYTEIVPSTRTKSGIKLQGARIVAWLPDHALADVDSID
ncbi:MAG TPA: hypothetical protein VK147_02295 [Candidatus Didemnitutus sp.]|nr:hypothetical protein [Candidatus Didemnitutus sp.]